MSDAAPSRPVAKATRVPRPNAAMNTGFPLAGQAPRPVAWRPPILAHLDWPSLSPRIRDASDSAGSPSARSVGGRERAIPVQLLTKQ